MWRVGQAENALPRYFGLSPGVLPGVRARLAGGDKDLRPAMKALLDDAEEAAKLSPPSVMQKTKAPPSGDRHDYFSLAPYYWPDPARSNGLPYARHDGKVNPDSRGPASDRARLRLMGDSVETLALAYYFTGNEAYAGQAARFLRAWFLDPATRMNPNLNYAQGVPGLNDGRGAGIIEGQAIAQAADAVGLLSGSKAWLPADDAALCAWLSRYLDWLLTSPNGRHEASARNNHGTFYDAQTIRLGLILGERDLATSTAEAAKQKRIAVQITPEGRQPLELARTTSLSYSRVNLEALFLLATVAQHTGVDLWHYTTADGRSLRKALDFLLPYADVPAKQWPYQQIKDHNPIEFAPILRQAALVYDEPKYEAQLRRLPGVSNKRLQLLFPKPAGTNRRGNEAEQRHDSESAQPR
jgi:hypothetical protein